MKKTVKEFDRFYFEITVNSLIHQLSDKDCQRVEFLRGMMAAYREIIESKGWVEKEDQQDYFK